MSGFEITLILIGIVCGNLGAVLIPPVNIGLWWNSVSGATGALAFILAPKFSEISFGYFWAIDFIAAGLCGVVTMLVIGGGLALFYRF